MKIYNVHAFPFLFLKRTHSSLPFLRINVLFQSVFFEAKKYKIKKSERGGGRDRQVSAPLRISSFTTKHNKHRNLWASLLFSFTAVSLPFHSALNLRIFFSTSSLVMCCLLRYLPYEYWKIFQERKLPKLYRHT